jgi:hypothetical protein
MPIVRHPCIAALAEPIRDGIPIRPIQLDSDAALSNPGSQKNLVQEFFLQSFASPTRQELEGK